MESAEELFASRGFHQTTIADISLHSGMHEASIFQHFKTKENLLVSIPERRLKRTLAGITEHLQGMKGAEPKLRKLMRHQLRDLSVNRAYTSILLLELRTLPAFYSSQAYKNTHGFRRLVRSIVQEGRDSGAFRKDFKTDYYLHLIQGAFEHEALARMMLSKRKATIGETELMINLLLGAVKT